MEVVTHKLMNFGYRISFQNLDKGNFENFGALGYSVNIAQFSKKLSSLHSGFVFHYSFIMILAMVSFFIYLLSLKLDFSFDIILVSLLFSYIVFMVEVNSVDKNV